MTQDELPALLGGPPAFLQGPPPWPGPDPEVFEALREAHRDGSWGRYNGVHGERLVDALCQAFAVPHVQPCASGTYAVELALRALRVGPGDEVLLSAYDFPGNFLAVHAIGARPVLVDLSPGGWGIAVERLGEACGPSTRGVLVSHLHGTLVPMAEVMRFAGERGLVVLEDAAQAPGALVQGRPAGSWGDAGVLSFGGSKLLTAGRGGALLTARADVWQRAHATLMRGNLTAPLSELQAAVLLPQLRQLDARRHRRAENVRLLQELLAGLPGLHFPPSCASDSAPAFYKLGIHYDAAAHGMPRDRLVAALRAEGVALDEGFPAAHVGRSPRRYRAGTDLAEALRAHHGCVVLHHPVLLGSRSDIGSVARAFGKVQRYAGELSEM